MGDSPMPVSAPSHPHIGGAYTIFYYDDLGAAADWYADVLGLSRMLSAPGLEIFRLGGASCVALVGAGYGSQMPVREDNKGVILSLETEDLEGWHARLFRLGVAGVGQGLQTGVDGRTLEFKVRDPGGYCVEFFEWI